jgi:hypothetical protein
MESFPPDSETTTLAIMQEPRFDVDFYRARAGI